MGAPQLPYPAAPMCRGIGDSGAVPGGGALVVCYVAMRRVGQVTPPVAVVVGSHGHDVLSVCNGGVPVVAVQSPGEQLWAGDGRPSGLCGGAASLAWPVGRLTAYDTGVVPRPIRAAVGAIGAGSSGVLWGVGHRGLGIAPGGPGIALAGVLVGGRRGLGASYCEDRAVARSAHSGKGGRTVGWGVAFK